MANVFFLDRIQYSNITKLSILDSILLKVKNDRIRDQICFISLYYSIVTELSGVYPKLNKKIKSIILPFKSRNQKLTKNVS